MTVDADPFAASMSIWKWLKSISVTSSRKLRYSRCPSLKLIISACWFGSSKLSIFFSIANYNNYLDFAILQRVITIIFSIATIIPLYLLCRKFFEPTYSLVAVSLFAFEPHIVQNSILGLSEPVYIFLAMWAFALILNNNQKLVFENIFLSSNNVLILWILVNNDFLKKGIINTPSNYQQWIFWKKQELFKSWKADIVLSISQLKRIC